MKLLKSLLLILLSLTLLFCGGNGDDSLKVKKRIKKVSLSEIKTPAAAGKSLRITSVDFGSFSDVENDLEAIPALSDKKLKTDFTFRWFINDREIKGENKKILSNDYLREDDWVYCWVRIEKGDELYPEIKSTVIQIRGPLPRVKLTMVKKFGSPGIFRYKINADLPEFGADEEFTDPEEDISTEDPEIKLKFELISPLEKGIELDPSTGEIVWDITQEIIDELGAEITIRFSITSPGGRVINSSISLTLKEGDTESGEEKQDPVLGAEIE